MWRRWVGVPRAAGDVSGAIISSLHHPLGDIAKPSLIGASGDSNQYSEPTSPSNTTALNAV